MNQSIGPNLIRIVLCAAAVALCACADEPEAVTIDLQVFPARLDDAPQAQPPEGFQRVQFAGNQRSPAATYLVSDQSILTGWSITAVRVAEEPDGTRAISFRLNAAAKKRLAEFTADPANLKTPLGLRINGRWADFSPLLRPPGDRMSLYGLAAAEAALLERWLQVR